MADELMVTTMVYGKAERLRSYELLAREWGLSAPPPDISMTTPAPGEI